MVEIFCELLMKRARRQLVDIGDHDELFGTSNSNIKFPLIWNANCNDTYE